MADDFAPGWPGIAPRWTSSAKSGVGTALGSDSRIWFTLSHGIINEVYYPDIDRACIRDLGLIVTGGAGFFSEEKRQATSEVEYLAPGVPAYRLTNTCTAGRYRVQKEIVADPRRATLLQRTRFQPLVGALSDYHLFALLAPHLGNRGTGNTAWVGDYKGTPMLFAQRGGDALALACSVPWLRGSAGFVGSSDGWQDLMSHGRMTWMYERAENGNVALTGEIDLDAGAGVVVLALGFGLTAAEAGQRALASLQDGFDTALSEYVAGWQDWQASLEAPAADGSGGRGLSAISAAVLRTHEAKRFPGGMIASLSIPWGFAKGDDDLGGYHLVWPRDLVEAAGGLLAAGATVDVRRVLGYLEATQEADGHWPQNMWLDGTPYWQGVQMDETAFPILLVDLARREHALRDGDSARFWPMARRAAGYVVRNGPVTQQDRWEEDAGYSPFTLAAEIAALLAAADLADESGESVVAEYLRETADYWNDSIERWTYVSGTPLARQVGVDGYYVRIGAPAEAEAASPAQGFVPIKNRPPGASSEPATHIVSPDALALVRFGLRAPNDVRILNTVRVIDALLRVELPAGPCWHRYNDDGYGEHPDGSPFDGEGVGRAWPLLTGERAHYELDAGRPQVARQLLRALEGFANEAGLISEQVWDDDDLPNRELCRGRPSGSAMPLVWAHAEYVKLCRSLRDGRVFDQPRQTVQRYRAERPPSRFASWRFNQRCRSIPTGKMLRLEALAPATARWSMDGWQAAHDTPMRDTGLGVFVADLPTDQLPRGADVVFTFYWPEAARWEGTDYHTTVE